MFGQTLSRFEYLESRGEHFLRARSGTGVNQGSRALGKKDFVAGHGIFRGCPATVVQRVAHVSFAVRTALSLRWRTRNGIRRFKVGVGYQDYFGAFSAARQEFFPCGRGLAPEAK